MATTATEARDRGRALFAGRAWRDAYAALAAADAASPLDAEDLERLATAADLLGRDADFADASERAYHAYLNRGDEPRAARSAFWLGFGLVQRGELARGGAASGGRRRRRPPRAESGPGQPPQLSGVVRFGRAVA